jgi:tetratricopeptide (TPR) repeat protein
MRTYLTFLAAFAAVSIFAQNSPLEQGRAALLRGDADAAVSALEKAVAQSPNDAVAHYWLGSAYGTKAQQSGMFSAAMLAPKVKEQFEKAVAVDPKYVEARMGLVEFYAVAPGFMGGDFDKAAAQAAELRKLDPLQGHRAYAVIYSAQKKPELAKKEYQSAIQEQPASPKAHQFLGQYLASAEKNFKGAFDEFEAAVKADPAYMPALYWLGRTAGSSGTNLARGEEALKKYLGYTPKEGEPPLANTHYWLGMIYEKQGRKADAKQEYQASLKLNPALKQSSEALKRVS